jgi:large subunit ribosomal protein L17
MRHYKKGRKLGTDASHTRAIKKNLVVNLFINDRIKTTLERAKEIRGDVDRVITWAKRGDVHSRRLAIAKLGDKTLVAEIFSKVEQGMFADRPGGYSRIMRLGTRRGDSATIVIMELVQEPVNKKAAKDADEKPAKKAATKKAPAKKSAKAKDEALVADEDDDDDDTTETVPPVGDEAVAEAVDAEAADAPEPEAEVAADADAPEAEAPAAPEAADAPEAEAPADTEAPAPSGDKADK